MRPNSSDELVDRASCTLHYLPLPVAKLKALSHFWNWAGRPVHTTVTRCTSCLLELSDLPRTVAGQAPGSSTSY